MPAPLFEPDSVSWATTGTGWGRGVRIQGLSNPLVMTVVGNVLDGKSVGSHTPLFQIHVKAGTHLNIRIVVDGLEHDLWSVAGENLPDSEADLNIDQLASFALLDGEVATITMWTTIDGSSAEPAPDEQAWYTFSNIQFTPSTLPPPPPTLSVSESIVTTTVGQPISTTGSHGPGSSGQPHALTTDTGTIEPSTPQVLAGTWIWSLDDPELGDAGLVTVTNSDGAQSTQRTFSLVVNAALTGDLYVSGQGDDGADGLTPATAIRTLSKMEELVQDNDLVLVERGYTYNEFLLDSLLLDEKTGVVLAPFGSGPAPIIDGQGLYPRFGGDLFPTVQLGLVQFRNCINCTIRGFRIINSRHAGVVFNNGLNGPTASGNTCEENHIQFIRSWGTLDIRADHNNAVPPGHPHITGSIYRYNTVEDVCTAVNEPTNLSTPGVTQSRSDNNSVGAAGGEAMTFRRSDSFECYGNLIRNTNKEGFATSNSIGGTSYNNRIGPRYPSVGNASVPIPGQETAYGGGTGASFYCDGSNEGMSGFHGYGNECFGDASGIVVASESGGDNDDILIENNISWGHNTMAAGIIGGAGNTENPGDSTNVRWYHNVFASDQAAQNVVKFSQPVSEMTGLEFKGNVVYRSVTSGQSMVWNADGQTAADYVGIAMDYNAFWTQGAVQGYKGTNPLTADPLFESHSFSATVWPGGSPGDVAGALPQLNTEFYLSAGSPLIGAVPVPYSVNDMVGNTRSTPTDTGPFERT